MGDRYRLVAAMMEDPLNMACVLRELERLHTKSVGLLWYANSPYLTPVVRSRSGVWGFSRVQDCFYDFPEEEQLLYAIMNDGKGYFIITPDEGELGPFDTFDVAVEQAKTLAQNEGFIVLDEIPWQGLKGYPMPI